MIPIVLLLLLQNMQNGRLLSNIFYIVVGFGELVLLAACGSLISSGSDLIPDALSDVEWPTMKFPYRRDFAFLVSRAKMECTISFMHWIPCNVESLRFVVTAGYNMFALLQNIARRKMA